MPTAVACRLCEMQQHHHRGGSGVLCPVSAAAAGTPLSVLPGHRHRDRSRDVSVYNQFRRRPPIDDVTRYHQHQQHLQQQQQQHQHQQQAEYGASVLLATPSPSSGSRDSSGRWRQRRRRSPSRRQRIHASLLRQFSPRRSSPPPPLQQLQQQPSYSVDYSKCPLCQPRYSPSPDRLGLKPVTPRIIDTTPSLSITSTSTVNPRGRPPKPQSNNDYNKKPLVEKPTPSRRSKSEYRHKKSSTKMYDIELEVKRPIEREVTTSWSSYKEEMNGNHGYSEVKENVAPAKKVSNRERDQSSHHRRSDPNNATDKTNRARSKSRSRYGHMANNGLLTVWPGKEGVWLPQ